LPASVKRQIAPASLFAVTYKGKAYGVPEYNSSKHFFYNKKMLDVVGMHRPPATLDQMLTYCEILKRNKKKLGIEYPMSWSWKQAESLTCDYVQMIDSLGGRFFAADNVTPTFNKGAGVKALTMMKLMLDKGYAAPGSLSHDESAVETDLQTGKIAMSTNWEGTMTDSINPSIASRAVLGHIRMALIPGSATRRSGSCLGPEGWAVMKSSQHQREAKAFLNWWVQKNTQKQGMLRFDVFPIYSAMYTDPELRALTKKADGVNDFAIYGAQFNYAQARPNFPGYLDASQKLQVHLHKAFLGSETPQKALNAAAAEMRAASGGGNNP
jgi:multiple sugar transport system substrate-binding protein